VGGLLPNGFWKKNSVGVCGGIEFGFLSTTTDLEVAKTYAQGSGGRAATVFEIKMGMVDRGADLSCLSQYPHEKEICFAPLTGIEVQGTRVEGSLLLVQARLNINLVATTIEEVVAKRRKMVIQMCDQLQVECEELFEAIPNEEHINKVLADLGTLKGASSMREHTRNLFAQIKTQPAEVFNDDLQLKKALDSALGIKDGSWLDLPAIEALGAKGKQPSACAHLLARRLSANEAKVREAVAVSLGQVTVRGDGDGVVVQSLVRKMDDKESRVRIAATAALGHVSERGNPMATEALVRVLTRGDLLVREAAARALGQVVQRGDQAVIQVLLEKLNSPESMVLEGAVLALGEVTLLGDRAVMEKLAAMFHYPDGNVRQVAARALGQIAEATPDGGFARGAPAVYCLRRHEMKAESTADFNCNVCRGRYTGPRFHCQVCSYDWCLACHQLHEMAAGPPSLLRRQGEGMCPPCRSSPRQSKGILPRLGGMRRLWATDTTASATE